MVSNKTTHQETQERERKASTVDNEIDVEGARALSDALKTNTTLTRLDLSGEQGKHTRPQGKHSKSKTSTQRHAE